MTKFIRVDDAPETLKSGEIVVREPNFVDEIRQARNMPRPIGGRLLTTLNHLRSIVGVIGELYDPEGFNPYSSIPLNHFVGIEFKDAEDLSSTVKRMFTKHYPQIYFKYLDKQLKSRPQGTELIYFVGTPENAEAFLANGIDQMDFKEAKKVVES